LRLSTQSSAVGTAWTWHSSPEAFTRDRARQRELELDGWRIVRLIGSEITKDASVEYGTEILGQGHD
jgi:very-short-patch-repair endonuclease